MKKLFTKLSLICLMMLFALNVQADIVFKFKAPTHWDACYLWAWDDNQKQLASSSSNWPGDAEMRLGPDGYYTYTLVTTETKVNFLFNSGGSTGFVEQTVDEIVATNTFIGTYGPISSGFYTIIDESGNSDPYTYKYVVAGNGADDPNDIWVNGLNWNASSSLNEMLESSNGIYTKTYYSVPAGTWNFRVVTTDALGYQSWSPASALDYVNSSANVSVSEGSNIVFTLNRAANVTIKYNTNNGKITITTPSGSFDVLTINSFSITATEEEECNSTNTFSASNNNKLTFREEITSISENGYIYKTYRIVGNCKYSVYEKRLDARFEEIGTYDVTITFNGNYDTPVFNVSTEKVTSPTPEIEVKISAIRDRLSINTNDFTDFAGLYVSSLPSVSGAEISYQWQYSSNNRSWSNYSDGEGATWDNIRPNKAGYYRCVITYNLPSGVTTHTSNMLRITDNGGSSVSFSSKLPVILVRTAKDFPNVTILDNAGVAEMKDKRSVDVKILWNQQGGNVRNTDVNNATMLHYDRKARMNYRGSSSLRNDKKSYAFVTGDKNCDPKKLGEVKTKKFGMFGEAAQKDWVLYASAPDATYMRNVLSFHQYAQMTGLWGVKCRYVELYIDGSYEGIYVFMDKITQDENRVNINEDTGYIVKFDKTDEVDSYDGTRGYNEDYKRNTFITSNTGKRHIRTYEQYVDQAFEIDFPEREDIAEFDGDGNVVNDAPWDAKVSEVKGMFTAMEEAILENDYAKLASIIDYESWADWFIMNEFSRNADAYRISCVFTINSAGDKIVANPIWDYELGWGYQDTQTSGLMVDKNSQYYDDSFPTPFWWIGYGKSGCDGILGDCKFRAIVKKHWEKHIGTNGALNSNVLNAKIDSLQAALRGSSQSTSVSTIVLKNWISSRTTALNSIINSWEVCEVEEPETPMYVVRGNGGSDATGIWCGGIEWADADSPVNNMTDADKDGIYEVTYKNVPAGTWNFKVVGATEGWMGSNYLDIENSSKYYTTAPDDGNIGFTLNASADVTIKFNTLTGRIILTTPSGSFGKVKIEHFHITVGDNECLPENEFTAANNYRLTFTQDIEIDPFSGYFYLSYHVIGNRNYAIYEETFGTKITEDGTYDITVQFNGDYDYPEFTISAVKQGSEPIIPDPVISNIQIPTFAQVEVGKTASVTATYKLDNNTTATASVMPPFYINKQIVENGVGSVEILFQPTTTGTYDGTLIITSGKTTESKAFRAIAVEAKPVIKDLDVEVIPAINAGEVATITATYKLENAETAVPLLSGDDVDSDIFSIESASLENGIGTVKILFMPEEFGDYKATLIIKSGEVSEEIEFSATALYVEQEAEVEIKALIAPAFKEIYEGELATAYASFELVNAEEFTPKLEGDKEFTLGSYMVENGLGYVMVYFLPEKDGKYNGTLTITSGEVIASIDFSATAIKVKPAAEIKNLSISDFESVSPNQISYATAKFDIQNSDEAEAIITEGLYSKYFAIVPGSMKIVNGKGSVQVMFMPDEVGKFNAELVIISGETSINLEIGATSKEPEKEPIISDLQLRKEFGYIPAKTSKTVNAMFNIVNATEAFAVVECDEFDQDAFMVSDVTIEDGVGMFKVTFMPDYAGEYNATITVISGTKYYSIDIVATATKPNPQIVDISIPKFEQAHPDEIKFVTATYTLLNADDAEVEVESEDEVIFIQSNKLNGSKGEVKLGFEPTEVGEYTAKLIISSGETKVSKDITATCIPDNQDPEDIEPEPEPEVSISGLTTPIFENVYLGGTSKATVTYTLQNASTTNVGISGSGAYAFTVTKNFIQDGKGTIVINFNPFEAGKYEAQLMVSVGEVVESVNLKAEAFEALPDPAIKDVVVSSIGEIYAKEIATITITYTLENAEYANVILSGDSEFELENSVVFNGQGVAKLKLYAEDPNLYTVYVSIVSGETVHNETININVLDPAYKPGGDTPIEGDPEISDLQKPMFPVIELGESVQVTTTYVIKNAIDADVTITGAGAAAFTILKETIVNGSIGIINIEFKPETVGTFNATLTVTSGEATASTEISATVNTVAPKPVIKDLTLPVFPNVYAGETVKSQVVTYTLENATKATASISGKDADAFTITKDVVTGGKGFIVIAFEPEKAGVYTATLTITSGKVKENITFTVVAEKVPGEDPGDFTAIDEAEEDDILIYANNGTIYSDVDFTIYTVGGLNVTHLNGALEGIYVVKTEKRNVLISVW